MGEKERAKRKPMAGSTDRTGQRVKQGLAPENALGLDHGARSLVAQDSPDDSQLGAPDGAATEEPIV